MSEQNDVVRSQTFETEGPVELDLELTAGAVRVRLGDGDATAVTVRRISAPGPQTPPWADGAAGVLNWVGEMFGGQGGPFPSADTVHDVRVDELDGRIVVRGPKTPPPMAPAVEITVTAPTGSHVRARTRGAAVTVHGTCGRAEITTGSGAVTVERVDKAATVRTSSGEIDIGSLGGPSTVNAGSARVRVGEVVDTAFVRTTSGEIVVGDAAGGSVDASSGSGDIHAGIREGVSAEIELASRGGTVRSDLDVDGTEPDEPVSLTVRARSGFGDIVVSRAT